VPKQDKTEQTNGSTAHSAGNSTNGEAVAEPKKRARSAKAAPKKPAAKKASAKTGAKKTATRKTAARKSKGYEPSDDDIRIRAYFLAERRVQLSLAGDPAQDWIDARQQLIDESGERHA
jgi:hypothetical protein